MTPLEGVFSIHLVEHIFSFARKLIITQDIVFSGSMAAQVKEPFIKQSYYFTLYQGGDAFLGMGLEKVQLYDLLWLKVWSCMHSLFPY